MMVLKKKEVIATALVVLIGVAGYLNWSYQDTIQVSDGESYLEDAKKLGEAEFVSSPQSEVAETSASPVLDEYFSEAKLSKDNSRSRALEILNETAVNESFDGDVRRQDRQRIEPAEKRGQQNASTPDLLTAQHRGADEQERNHREGEDIEDLFLRCHAVHLISARSSRCRSSGRP